MAVIGAGMAGMVAAYELMKLGLKPVVGTRAERIGGRLRSEPFVPGEPEIAELGGMRFPISSRAFHYVDMFSLTARPFPNPLTPASGSTVIDIGGQTLYARTLNDLPEIYREIANAWDAALERIAGFGDLQDAIRRRDTDALKETMEHTGPGWDDRSFYDFSPPPTSSVHFLIAIGNYSGQVGFGTGGWDWISPIRCWKSSGWW